MATGTLVSLQEYLTAMYEPDCEYLEGEILERNMGEVEHGSLQGLLVAWLFQRRKAFGIHVFPETRTQVAPARLRVPDIAVTLKKPRGHILTEPPFLCIEILSPEDRASRVEEKIDDYLKFGVPYIWLIDPRRQVGWSYTREGKREEASILTTENPQMQLPIGELFADLDQERERG